MAITLYDEPPELVRRFALDGFAALAATVIIAFVSRSFRA